MLFLDCYIDALLDSVQWHRRIERTVIMVGTVESKHQSRRIRKTGRLLFWSIVFLVPISASFLFSGRVAQASTGTTPHGKPPLSSSTTSSAPTNTVSRYITHKDTTSILYTDGCNQATAFVGGVVFLDFGETVQQNGVFGTFLPGTITGFVSNNSILALVKQYLKGYAACDKSTTGASLILAIGTTNGGPYLTSTANASSAGQEWANLVVSVRAWIGAQGFAKMERVFGAIQINLENNTATITRAWVDGFGVVSSNKGVNFINYGDATGCPTTDSSTNGACGFGWTQNDLAYVSWDAIAAYPLPQIYDTAGKAAFQWQSIEYYQRINNLGGSLGPMYVQGALTQYEACLQTGGCQGTNNTPSQGWQQLYNALQTSSVTAQPHVWDSTDFRWDN